MEITMRSKRKFWALALVVTLGITSVATPISGKEVDEDIRQMSQSDMQSGDMKLEDVDIGSMDPAVEEVDLPKENGKYVIYMEDDYADEVSLINDVYEITTDSQEVIVETDLSAVQFEHLEELSNLEEEVYVEENIFLTGASDTLADILDVEGAADGENKSRKAAEGENESDIEYRDDEDESGECDEEDTDYAERLALKRELVRQLREMNYEDTEAEWNMQMIHADEADTETVADVPVKVAVLDSGVEFISGIPVEKSVNFVKDEQDLPYYMNDMTGHGTAVADIIHQVCPKAQIYSVKVMDIENRGRLSDVVAGIYWCIEQNVDIINMSFGTSVESDILRKAIHAAAEQGIMMVSSAGNGGSESAVEYPAAFEEVIAVGAVDTSGKKTKESAAGDEVELVAPGKQILTKSMLGFETINSGTSMAAPHVTGAAALLMQQSDYKNALFIRRVLDKSSNPLGENDAYGYGLVDVTYAQELLSGYQELLKNENENARTTDAEKKIDDGRAGEMTLGEAVWDMFIEPKTEAGQETDMLDALEQISRPVETFAEVDYVEGRWEAGDCKDLADYGWEKCGGYTQIEMSIFKVGAAYVAQSKSGLDDHKTFPEWHGWKSENYIANFIFATRIAKAGGDTANLKKVRGQSDVTYNRMKNTISVKKVGNNAWKDILAKWNYSSQNDKTKKLWRQTFLYGMSLHTATDVFSYSTYFKNPEDGKITQFYTLSSGKTPTRNDRTQYPNRWKCAKNTAYYAAINCSEKIVGEIEDFSSCGEKYWKGFYIGNILKYANAVDGGDCPEWMQENFQAVNYDIP